MDKKVKIVESVLDDVYELAPRLRQDDINEVKALGFKPEQSLLQGFIYSDICYSVKHNNKTIGMFGTTNYNLPNKWGSIWFLGSDETINFPVTFIREGKKFLKQAFQKYDILVNAVDSRNTSHIKYIEHIGLIISNPIMINGYKFLQFYGIKEK